MNEGFGRRQGFLLGRGFNAAALLLCLASGIVFVLTILALLVGADFESLEQSEVGLLPVDESVLWLLSCLPFFQKKELWLWASISFLFFIVFLALFGWSTFKREIAGGFGVYDKIKLAKSDRQDEAESDESGFSPTDIKNVTSLSSGQATDEALASLFLTACVTPREIYNCIDERLTPAGRCFEIESYVTFKIPYSFRKSPFVIPVLFHCRGAYPDSLTVTETSGSKVTVFNLTETFDYVEHVLSICLPGIREKGKLWSEITSFLEDSRSMSVAVIENRCVQAKNIVEAIDGISEFDRFREKKKIFERFIYLLVESYPICLRCVAGADIEHDVQDQGRTRLQYRASRARSSTVRVLYRAPLVDAEDVIGENRKALGHKRELIHKLLIRLGKRPNTFYYGLGNADRTQSYHFQSSGSPDTFCSMVALRCRAVEIAIGPGEESECGGSASIDEPQAEMAYIQNRLGQNSMSLSVKNGSGFHGWFIMHRFTPVVSTSHLVALLASFLSAVMLWVIMIGQANDAAASLVATMLVAVSSACVAWVLGRGSSARGSEKAPFLTALLIVLSSVLSLLSLVSNLSDNFVLACSVVMCFALLCSTCVALLVHSAARWRIVASFRRETAGQVSLVNGSDSTKARTRVRSGEEPAHVWSPGWIAIDGDRFVSTRLANGVFIRGSADTDFGTKWVLRAFVTEREDDGSLDGVCDRMGKRRLAKTPRLMKRLHSALRRCPPR